VETTEAEAALQAFVLGKTVCPTPAAKKIQNLKLFASNLKLNP
jgi:hypothetical protein